MNGKIATAAVSALMLISLISVFQAGTASAQEDPVPAVEFQTEGDGIAEWTAAENYSGDYSVRLYVSDGSTDWAEVSIPVDIAIENITELKFWEMIESYSPNGWNVNVILGIDADGDDVFEADVAEWHVGDNAWTLEALNGDTFVEMDGALGTPPTGVWNETDALTISQWWTPDSSGAGFAKSDTYPWSFYGALADFIDVFIPDSNQTSLIPDTTAHVKVVKLLIGGSGSWMDETAYVDYVTINGVTYDLEIPSERPLTVDDDRVQCPDAYFQTIQSAIDAASPGDTVLVHPGTYEEYILINKPLTVKSTDGAEETIIDGIGFRYMVRIYSEDVTFEGFTVTNPTYEGGADASGILIGAYLGESVDNVNILNNIVKAVRSGTTGSPSMYGATGINIGRSPLSNVVVSGNTIENIHNPDGASVDHTCGINVWDGAENVLISNNAISDIKYNGIILQYVSNVRIENNTISECEVGIRVEPFEGATVSDLTIHHNNIENNGKQLIDASGDLDIAEILANNTFDRAVIVETASYLPFIWSSIQDAINDASPGDTVLVYPGTYNENINIDKSLTVRSVEGAEVTIINAQEASMGVLINGADTVATFDGFTVENYLTAGILAGAFSPTWGDDPVEVHILNNIVKEPMGEAHNNCIQLGDGTTGTVIGNEVSGAFLESPDWSGSGIIVAGSSNVLVSNNYVHDCESGIVVLGYDYKNAPAENNVIRNNTVENCEAGISIEALVIDTTIENNWVINNEITGIQVYGYDNLWGIEASVPAGTKIHYNDIVGNKDYGVVSSVWGSGGVVSAEQVDATHNWWGHPSGPRRDKGNPNCKAGRGDRVSENVRYHPWLSKPFQTVLEKHVGHYGFEGRYLEKGWNTLSVPIYLDNNAWVEIAACLNENIAYRFDASTQAWELMTTGSKLDPLDAIYIRMNSENIVPLVVSVSIRSPPVKELKRGWNLVGLAVWENENMPVDQVLVSVEQTPNGNRGYTIVVSSPLNQEPWTYTIGQTEKPLMNKNKAYWVYMENPDNLAGFSTTPLPFWEPE